MFISNSVADATVRFAAAALAVGLCLFGCTTTEVPLLTGIQACYAGGEHPVLQGMLIPDPEFGTRIAGKGPVMWPVGYTARRLEGLSGEIQVLGRSGDVVARTGRTYMMAPAPDQQGDAGLIMERTGAIASPDCYPWDLVDCSPLSTDHEISYCPRS